MIEAVLVDLGGVLIDPGPAAGLPFGRLDWRGRRALLEVLRRDRRRLTMEDLDSYCFAPWQRRHKADRQRMEETDWAPYLEELKRRAGSQRDDLELLSAWFRPYGDWLRPLPGAAADLERLVASGYRLALISNTPLPGELYRRVLERHGLAAPFDHLAFSYDAGSRKPSPRMLLAAVEALDAVPERAVMVGDRKSVDVAAGLAAGTRTVWLRSTYSEGPAADAEIGSLAELPELLARWGGPAPTAPQRVQSSPMRSITDFMSHFRRQRGWTRDLVAAVPEERFDWAPAEDAFSCGDLVRHLMQAEIFWRKMVLAAVAGEAYDPFALPGGPDQRLAAFRAPNLAGSHSAEMGASFAECLERWAAIQAATEERLGGLADDQLATVEVTHPITGLSAPLWEMLLVMLEHEAHHRGQLSAYLKVLGLAQPPVLGRS